MLFKKNKKKIILIYLICYIILFLLISLLSLISFLLMTSCEIFLVGTIFAFRKLHIAEVRQTVEFSDEKLICKSFIVNGVVVDGEIPYEKVKRIELKKKCVIVIASGMRPIRITNDYIDFKVLCEALCEKCKDAQIIK